VLQTTNPKNEVLPKVNVSSFGQADLLLMICVSIWAFNVPIVKSTLAYFEPLQISLIRIVSAAIIFTVYVWFKEGSLKVQRKHLLTLVAAGFIGITLNQVFFVYALSNTHSAEVSLLMGTIPSFATLMAWLLGQEKVRLNYWLSLPLAIAGVSLIILSTPGASLEGNLLGDFMALLTAFTWGTYTVLISPLFKHYSASRVSVYILVIGAIGLLPFGVGQFHWERMASVPTHIWWFLAYSAIGAIVITNILWFTGVKILGAPRTAFYAYLQPFIGVFSAALILGEQVVGWQIVGGVLVVFSMILYRMKLATR
jgi:drug/metabolite transporter (DMT)-like permease